MILSKKTSSTTILLYFVYFYLAIFGPKIGGFIDISAIINLLIFWFVITKNKGKLVLKNGIIEVIIPVLILFMYTLILVFFTKNPNIVFMFKIVRALLATLGISAFIERKKEDCFIMLDVLEKVLLVHAIVIIIGSVLWLDLQNILKPITGFERMPSLLRSTGLTNGYDFAGVLCVFGILLSFYSNNSKNKTLHLLIFIIASFLTSRINMIIAELIIFFLAFLNRKKKPLKKAVMRIILIVSIIPVLGLFLFSTNNYNNIIVQTLLKNEFFARVSNRIVYYYATTDIQHTIGEHFDFSRLKPYEFWIGSLQDSKQDPGYTQYIYSVGIVGLVIALIFYFIIAGRVLKNRKYDSNISTVVLLIVSLCLVLSVKNSYILARHVTETLLILFNIFLCEISQNNCKNQTVKSTGEKTQFTISDLH